MTCCIPSLHPTKLNQIIRMAFILFGYLKGNTNTNDTNTNTNTNNTNN